LYDNFYVETKLNFLTSIVTHLKKSVRTIKLEHMYNYYLRFEVAIHDGEDLGYGILDYNAM
jgi:hypothetical protein